MPLHDDLLALARELAYRNPAAAVEADLRRAVSTAYYALFHLLVHEATTRLVAVVSLRSRVARSFDHRIMRAVCKEYSELKPDAAGQLVKSGNVVPQLLQQMAGDFVELQAARSQADYDTGTPILQGDAQTEVFRAETAFVSWIAVQSDPAADAFLAELLCRGIPKR
jgi:hypothetical protein